LVFNPAFITQEFDLLRFEAAAFDQLPKNNGKVDVDIKETNVSKKVSPIYSSLLISSPYNNPNHYLDFATLPTQSILFAKALTVLKPVRPDYATAPYTSALNFDNVLSALRNLISTSKTKFSQTSFYVVVFQSQLKQDIDMEWLYKLDFESHREACESGGLLKYWFGKSNGEGENLATCFWHSREDAYNGGRGPWHKKARAAGRELYEKIAFSTHKFTVLDGAEGFKFEDW
ncbi:hypothetical protein GQ44DRAFT_566293, partial [Phaeosphaeriaceae sp. PMI808]